MPKSPFAKRDEQHELSRRSLIRWTLAAGIGLGVSRTKVNEILEKHVGKEAAMAAGGKQALCRSLHIDDGGGGLSNWSQVFPHVFWGVNANPAFPWANGNDDQPGSLMAGTAKPLLQYNGNPFANVAPSKQVSCFTAGTNNTHTVNLNTSTFGLGGVSLPAFAAKVQATAISSVLPALNIGSNAGPAAVPFATAGNAAGAVNLFNSVASQLNGLLYAPAAATTNTNADLFASHLDVLSSLNRVARDPIQGEAYKTARSAARFIAKNLAAALTVSPAELAEYGQGGSNAVARLRQDLAFAHKAFSLGLTNTILARGFNNDPHGYWDNGVATYQTESRMHRKAVETFFAKMAATDDPSASEKLLDSFVFVVQGDTPKNYTQRPGWGDGSMQNSNLVYAYTSGWVKSGWHGRVTATAVTSAGDNGTEVTYNGTVGANKALAAIAFAICKGDDRLAQEFTGNNLDKSMVNTAQL